MDQVPSGRLGIKLQVIEVIAPRELAAPASAALFLGIVGVWNLLARGAPSECTRSNSQITGSTLSFLRQGTGDDAHPGNERRASPDEPGPRRLVRVQRVGKTDSPG